jgi:uncharacterized membrane protein YdbT with pleckstrin-like domain
MSTKLSPSDAVTYTAALSWWAYAHQLIIVFALLAGSGYAVWAGRGAWWHHAFWLWVPAVMTAAYAVLKRRSIRVEVTEHHVIFTRELVSRSVTTLNLHRIESVDIDQTFFQRMLGFGSVIVRGVGNEDIVVVGLANPEALKEAVLAVTDVAPL